MLYHFPLVFPGGVSPYSEFSVHLLGGHGLQVYQTLRLVRFGDEDAQPTGHGSEENLFGSKVKNLRLPCNSIKDFFLLYRYWWNTRIFPFTKKSYLHRAVKILFLSFTCEDIGVAMVTNIRIRILSTRAESISHSFVSLTRARYFQHSKIKFVSPLGHVISSTSIPHYRNKRAYMKWRKRNLLPWLWAQVA